MSRRIVKGWMLPAVVVAVVAGCGSESRPHSTARPMTSAKPHPAPRRPVKSAVPVRASSKPIASAKPPSVPRPTPPVVPPTPGLPAMFRPSDSRPRHDAARLAAQGIGVYESRHLRLYTDIDPQIARTLPPLIDAVYPAWEAYFGPLPPDRERTDFQMTGYLMRDQKRFRTAGLLPENLPSFLHGRHLEAEFWMNEQEFDYYRRHLLLHEATHCYMTYGIDPGLWPAPWYMEGMAEHFGTHQLETATGSEPEAAFRVMPDGDDDFQGHGRIALIRKALRARRGKTLAQVFALRGADYVTNEPYAWSWAVCHWLDRHPHYRDRFHELAQYRTRREFERAFFTLFGADLADMQAEWELFIRGLQPGYDIERAAVDWQPGTPLDTTRAGRAVQIAADRGWQSSGVRLERGQAYENAADGQFTLAAQPRPWVSEPQGISFRYFDGRPLGELLGTIRPDSSADSNAAWLVEPLGRQRRLVAPVTGTLYLRLNDSWSELADNTGHATVTLRRAPTHE